MNRVFFRNAMVWDGSGAHSFPADLLVEGNRIKRWRAMSASFRPTGRP